MKQNFIFTMLYIVQLVFFYLLISAMGLIWFKWHDKFYLNMKCIKCKWGWWIMASLLLGGCMALTGYLLKSENLFGAGMIICSVTMFPFAFIWMICEEGNRAASNSVGY